MEYRMMNIGDDEIACCLKEFKNAGFDKSIYSTFEESKSAVFNLIKIVVTRFSNKIFTIKNYKDICKFIINYPTEDQTDESIIAFKSLCNYIFVLIPQMHLDSTSDELFADGNNDISHLVAYAAAITELAQIYGYILVAQREIGALIIHDNGWSFHYKDDDFAELHQRYFSAIKQGALRGASDTTDFVKSYRDIIRNVFSRMENDVYNLIYPETQIFGLSGMTESEFEAFHRLYNPINKIVDLTDIISKNSNDVFLNGLIYTSNNSDLLKAVIKPQNPDYRPRFRPFIQIEVDNQIYYITTQGLYYIASCQIANGLFAYNELPKEWHCVKQLKSEAKVIKKLHSDLLENNAADILCLNGFHYLRNKKSLANVSCEKAKIVLPNGEKSRKTVGEIDFIIIDETNHSIFVADAKFLKPIYHVQSFGIDAEKFRNSNDGYESKLKYKIDWVSNNMDLLQKEISKELHLHIDLSSYNVEGFFITDNLVYYSLFSKYPIIPLENLVAYLNTRDRMCFMSK